MAGFKVTHLDDVGERVDGRCRYRPIRHHFGITGFGVTAWTAHAAGELILDVHDEDDPTSDQELFLVLIGHATFELEGERVDAPAGTLVFVPPGAERRAFAEEGTTTIIAVEGTPGKPYDARGWEVLGPTRASLRSG